MQKENKSSIKYQIHQYFKEEDAAEDIQTIILYIVAFSLASATGWWAWNHLKSQASKESCDNTDSPFCVG